MVHQIKPSVFLQEQLKQYLQHVIVLFNEDESENELIVRISGLKGEEEAPDSGKEVN